MSKQYSLGIDLGTSNSAVTLGSLDGLSLRSTPITQLVNPGMIAEERLLPSALYVPHAGECAPESLSLPWSKKPPSYAVGHWARERGSLAPDRVVTSAKSWLSNPHVDRRGAILPWQSESVALKYSPFEASRLYLDHLRQAVECSLSLAAADCHVVLTVPASFDETARTLTHEAAACAGLGRVTLLEEPQAAFYSWIADNGEDWRKQVGPGDLILVCDIGGGTADFSLIAVTETDGALELDRVSVGQHLLLGGDNMDLALAYTLRAQIEAEGHTLDEWQFLALVHASRAGKERVFGEGAPLEVPISVPTRGRSLFAETISTKLRRETAEAVIIDGFFPLSAPAELPQAGRGAGLREFGLPFVADPVVSKHLAQFLRASLENVRSDAKLTAVVGEARVEGASLLLPTAVLFNGGVFRADPIRSRVFELLASWQEIAAAKGVRGEVLRELTGVNLDLAVARGAAYYGAVTLRGQGLRIRSGTARSYYVGLETSMPAVPGIRPKVKGLCVVPQGVDEGTRLELPAQEFGLVVGQEVSFRFFSSAKRAGDQMGTVVVDAPVELEETSQIGAVLEAEGAGAEPGTILPVTVSCNVTEMGTLELWLEHGASGKRWQLEFNVRPS